MQLYPHWLDGEFVRIASNVTGPEQDVQERIRALKLHALLGTRFVLNDVQIFDSAAVLELFSDDDALKHFLRRDRTFLDLRVDPDPSLGERPFALAARGLTRTRAQGWISSLFMSDPTPIKRLADEIIEEVQVRDCVDLQRPSRTVQAYPHYEKWLEAVRRSVHYFGFHGTPQKLVAPPGERTSYYEVLHSSVERLAEFTDELHRRPELFRSALLAQVHEDLTHVEEAVNFINKEIEDPDARKARSRVLAILDHEPDRTKRERIWNNVVQAWNYATQKTLRPEGGSVGTLSGAVSPAPYLETPTDVLVPVVLNELPARMPGIAGPPTLPIDIDGITWKEIAEVREATVDTMEQLAVARHTGNLEQVSQPLRKHLDAVGRILHPPRKLSKTPYVLKLAGGAGGATVIAWFGDPATIAVAVTAAGISMAGTIGSDIWRDTGPWRQRRALTSTLFRAAMPEPK